MNYKIGQTFKGTYPPEAAVWCNTNNAHIEKQDGQYIIVANPPIPEPTLEEQVAKLEAETGLTRVMREMVLAENSGASDYVKAKANEIETLAEELRKQFFGGRDKTPPFSIDKIEKINYN